MIDSHTASDARLPARNQALRADGWVILLGYGSSRDGVGAIRTSRVLIFQLAQFRKTV